jgi:thiosulfate/3-mercaptopyruvate sulfurtransferase
LYSHNKKEDFQLNLNEKLLRDFAAINENLVTGKEEIIDARGQADFERVDPLDGKENHIPKSKNVPYSDLFDNNTGIIKDKKELLERIKIHSKIKINFSLRDYLWENFFFKVFRENDVDMNKPLIASCLTGMTACSLAFAADQIGLKNVSVYAVIIKFFLL